MKIQGINSSEERNIKFKGKRTDRNLVAQLRKNNPYSLTENNQRNISNAITRLGQVKGSKNINFLLDTAAKNTYSTNIVLKNTPKNNWKGLLISAALTAISLTPFVSKKIKEKLANLTKVQELKPIEEEILDLREQLLAAVDLKQINNETGATAKEFEKNLDYLIISSETTLEHKKYVLERLNYLMSDEYEINPQLADKKSVVVAEMVNDMAISRPDAKVPNVKAINQKQHGMCAAISIVRKKLVYEDKPNYVDSIISELDSTDHISVYDRNALGSGKKVKVQKVPVDFETALKKGYRIIDASTMHWMQIAHMNGNSNIALNEYIPFDRLNFDVRTDSFFNVKTEDEEVAKSQEYYQMLVKAQSEIETYKASQIKRNVNNKTKYDKFDNNIEDMGKVLELIRDKVAKINPDLTAKEVQEITSGLLNLEFDNSSKKPSNNPFAFISNEEDIVKSDKIKNYLLSKINVETINTKTLEEIFSLFEYYNSISEETAKIKGPSQIRKAQRLYEIAAAYRLQMITGLKEKETREAFMTEKNIPDSEHLVLETIDTLIKKIENNSGHTDMIIEQLAPAVGQYGVPDKANTLEYLHSLKDLLNRLITANIDDIYRKIALGSRENVYYLGLKNLIARAENCTKKEILHFSKVLKCKDDRRTVIEKFTDLAENLKLSKEDYDKYDTMLYDASRVTTNKEVIMYADKLKCQRSIGSVIDTIINLRSKAERKYKNAFDKTESLFGSPLELVVENFKGLVDEINSGNQETIEAFLAANDIEDVNDPQIFAKKLLEVQEDINIIAGTFNEYSKFLRIVDKDGDILYSANPIEVLIKKLEDQKVIIPTKNLRELQEHFDKIAKDHSSDEFGIMRGKLKDKSLEKFSKTEKQALKDTEESLDQMHAYVQKQLNEVQSDLKPMLEELKRVIGLNSGRYWILSEGSSGLSSEKQVRILEYMTGRPHYSNKNLEESIEKIKTEPYSGISTSSVSHTQGAWHAQYIADIAPVKVKVKDENGNVKEEVKEVLFNDNTWGIAERENTWIDSLGLLRTDYDSNRGGSLGYITNERYWNGNLVNRVLNDMILEETPDTTENRVYKRIVHNDDFESYKTSQYKDTILDGRSPEAKNIADRIHDAMFSSDTKLVENLKNIASKYTMDEIDAILNDTKLASDSWRSTYEELKKRIFPNFGEGITTKEQYDKLADNDYLKVALEKVAIKENYQIAGLETDLAEVRNVKELSKFKAAQKTRAINTFKYAFGKDHMVMEHLAKNFGVIEALEMYNILDKYKISLDDKGLELLSDFGMPLDLFTGSVKDMINACVDEFGQNIDTLFDNPEAKAELQEHLRKYLIKNTYFNKKDLENKKISHLVKFIDREFDPADDNEFVKIYRKIQDMTTEEFKKEIMPRVKPEDMGMKKSTGYSVLKRIQKYEEKANRDFMNTVYFDNLATEVNTKDYIIEYKRDKLTRKPKYLTRYDKIEPIYRELSYNLSLLTLPKLFNKYKAQNLEKYGAYPAYPKVNNLNDNILDTSYNSTIQGIENNIATINTMKNQLIGYDINKRLKDFSKGMKSADVLSEEQITKLNTHLSEFIVLNYNNESYMEIFEAIDRIMNLPEGSTWKNYSPDIKTIINRLNSVEYSAPRKFLLKSITDYEKQIDLQIKGFSNSIILKRYQSRITELLNNVKQAMIKGDPEKIEVAKNSLYSVYEKAHILNDPEELLETYIKSCAKDSDLVDFQMAYKIYMDRSLQYAQLAEVQEILMDAISDGVALSAKKLFNTIDIEMKDGSSMLMGSEEMVLNMVHKLLVEENMETAQMFLEKLGLAETYIEYISKSIDTESLKEMVLEAHEIAENYKKFKETVSPYIEEASKLVSVENSADKIINSLKKLIREAGKTYNLQNDQIVTLLKALDNIKFNYKDNPRADKTLIYNSIMSLAQSHVANSVQQQLDLTNSVMKSNTNLIIFIGNVILETDSKAHKARVKLIEKYAEVIELGKSLAGEDLQEY